MIIKNIMGDLTVFVADVVVNAANPLMEGGGGLDGAIHRAAGPDLLKELRKKPVMNGIRCPHGKAILTPGFKLPAKWIAHAVGPIYLQDSNPQETLELAYRSAMALAERVDARTVALPALSCGIYGFPPEEAAKIALEAVVKPRWDFDVVTFVHHDPTTFTAWVTEINRRQGTN